MENFTLHAVAAELSSLLAGQRLGKVHQLGATGLACDFRLRDGRLLVVSTDPQRLALYLTARAVRQLEGGARTDAAFALLVKKYLGGARLTGLEHLGYDRVVRFDFAAENEAGEAVRRALIVELTGPSANVFVTEAGRVLAELRERKQESRGPVSREQEEGEDAAPAYHEPQPPADKVDPFDCPPEKLDALIEQSSGLVAAAARKHLLGFGPLYAQELTARAKREPPAAALAGLLDAIFNQPPSPSVYSSAPLDELKANIGADSFALAFAPIELIHLRGQTLTRFPTVNEAADAYFTLLDERRSFLAERQRLASAVSARLKKQRALLAKLRQERDRFQSDERAQRFGELLLANAHQAAKVDDVFLVTDYYDAEQRAIEIPAAEFSTPQEAAEHYFKLARKSRSGLRALGERLPEVERDIGRDEAALPRLQAALHSLGESLGLKPARQPQLKPSSPQPGKGKKADEKISGVRRYRSTDGYEILVGRGDRDNDHLTMRVAKSYDLWFHAADYPGSHVVLRNPQRREVPPRAVTEAAQLAAKFSHARADARVAVNYCERKFVTKPKGFAPGQVRLSSFKTVVVEPKEAGERVL
jgi:predicted ribosome quality control (RQC) complex YloA/Tae2 family protein